MNKITPETIAPFIVDCCLNSDIRPEEITPQAKLGNDLGIESMDFLEILHSVDKAVRGTTPPESPRSSFIQDAGHNSTFDFLKSTTVQQFCDLLNKKYGTTV